MANTYCKILLHVVFAVKGRYGLIPPAWQPNLHAYIAKSLNERGHHALNVGGTENHVHLLLDFSGKETIPDMVRDLKVATNSWGNKNHICKCKFEWQKGYACFSVSPSHSLKVGNYIRNQNLHHHGRKLADEIKNMLELAGIKYEAQYLFNDDGD